MPSPYRPLAVAAACLFAATAPVLAHANCQSYFDDSSQMTDTLTKAFTAMNAKDTASYATILPQLTQLLDSFPASEIAAETCTDHINTYSAYQYTELSILRAHKVASGFSDTLPLVKQPELNHIQLAYAVGWINYEQGNYEAALAAYGKGLAMFPHNHELQNEYAATLLQLDRSEDAVTFVTQVLSDTYDLDDTMRGKMYAALGVAEVQEGDTENAESNLNVAQLYNYTDDTKSMLDSLARLKADSKGTGSGTQ
ncbi:MAG: tetratricopeptide repeat protein [Asticcacaulis sp.]